MPRYVDPATTSDPTIIRMDTPQLMLWVVQRGGWIKLDDLLLAQMFFSSEIFGPMGERGVQGNIDHIRKELAEIEAKPGDLSEWIDVVLLALDGAMRAHVCFNQDATIDAAHTAVEKELRRKLAENMQRDWPDWREVPVGTAVEHVRNETDTLRWVNVVSPGEEVFVIDGVKQLAKMIPLPFHDVMLSLRVGDVAMFQNASWERTR